MKEIINIIENEMDNSSNKPYSRTDRDFRFTMLGIATILVSLLEWIY